MWLQMHSPVSNEKYDIYWKFSQRVNNYAVFGIIIIIIMLQYYDFNMYKILFKRKLFFHKAFFHFKE
jgi:hypothetical protein